MVVLFEKKVVSPQNTYQIIKKKKIQMYKKLAFKCTWKL